MVARDVSPLTALYEADETAWLDAMSELAAAGRVAEMDLPHLGEYLADMAKRDRRAVLRRLIVLLAHLLKREYQPDKRTASWDRTIRTQRRELRFDLQGGSLLRYAGEVLPTAYEHARAEAAAETGLDLSTFPAECPFTLETALGEAG